MKTPFHLCKYNLLWTEYLCSPKFICCNPPNVMMIGSRPCGERLGHEGALMNGISALIKESPDSPLTLFPLCEDSEKSAVCNPEEDSHQNLSC